MITAARSAADGDFALGVADAPATNASEAIRTARRRTPRFYGPPVVVPGTARRSTLPPLLRGNCSLTRTSQSAVSVQHSRHEYSSEQGRIRPLAAWPQHARN